MFIISVGLAFTYAVSKCWVIGNLFAISLATSAIALLSVDSFFTGFLLLLGMLAFDVFWLFGTDILENISEALTNTPTSVVWPRNINTYLFNKVMKTDHYFTMFGLGDIIVPGIYIAYCLRFDKLNSWKTASSKRNSDFTTTRFSKPYFTASLLAYIASAGASIYTVHFTKKAQSALLFIVPALILSTLLTALIRNELSTVLSCSDVVKTFGKLCSFSANDDDNEEEEEDDDERPNRYKKVTRSTTTTTTTRGGRSVSRGGTRTKSAIRNLSIDMSSESDDCNFEAKQNRTIEEDVVAEHAGPKTRKRRGSSKASKK
ncbi:signal peptide peptidase-domain-containing protein [Mucor mucedo]|uniref:signal peptide peptidase-domain-containing protein n=1 Tax=Mucor mucedo TaxID=29922 RepID=UPI00221E4B52|nr:signal peptide peptidase-domain-containing protein [Mucor mucedo]KAI7888960.1 signal peptide peptidase-domain-containing protein [Mucor mucedo]